MSKHDADIETLKQLFKAREKIESLSHENELLRNAIADLQQSKI